MKKNGIVCAALCLCAAAALISGCTFTRYAARGDLAGVRKLVEKGEDINKHDSYGWTPIMWAVYYNYYDVVKYMLENKADPNARSLADYGTIAKDSTSLIIASYYGYGGIVRLLLKNKADQKARNRQGETAGSIAEKYNFMDIVGMLEKGPNYHAQSADEGRKKHTEADSYPFTIVMNDGKRHVGDVVAQTRTTITVRTRYSTTTIDKDNILQIITK